MKQFFTFVFLFLFFIHRAQVYSGPPGKILNNGMETYFNLSVSGLTPSTIDSTFGIEELCLNINHPKVEQLYMYLKSPSGTTVELAEGTSCQGANYMNTCFNSTVNTSITLGTAPYSGTYKPVGYFGRFNVGAPGNGTWTLIVKDYLAFVDSGNVVSWSIKFGNTPPHPVKFVSSNLPIMIINTSNQVIGNAKIMVNMGIIYNGVNQRNYATDPMNNYNAKALIHLHGNSTRYFEKKSYSLETHDLTGAKFVTSILGMPAETDWDLIAPYQDKTMGRIPLGYDLFGRMGHYSPRFRVIELIVNNEYWGIYHLVEKPKRDNNRINISKLTTSDNTFPNVTGGYIIKIDRNDVAGWYSAFPGSAPNNKKFYYAYDYPKDSDITAPQKTYIKNVLDTFETVMNSATYADPINGYPKYIDVNSFVDYFIINELSKNVDAYRLHAYLYKDKITKGGKLGIGPVWDFGIAFHNCNYGNSFSPAGWQYQLQDTGNPSPTWWNRFMQDSNFVNNLYCRWTSLRQNILSINFMKNYVDSTASQLTEALPRNFMQWPVLGAYVWPNPQNQVGATYQGEINDLKTWLVNRVAWMDANILGRCSSVGIAEYFGDNENGVFVYPNPFESSTTFSLRLGSEANVNLTLFDGLGNMITTIVNERKPQGESQIIFDKKQIASGIYFYRLKINSTDRVGKIIIQ
jgi:subtilisin-like proprotein convertase family protein